MIDLVRPQPEKLPFTAWLKDREYYNLAPTDDAPRPLWSRIAYLRNHGGSGEDVQKLMKLWEEWNA